MVDTIGMTNAVGGAPSYNGRMLRQLNAVGFAGATAARPLGARSGVRPGTSSTTVSASSTTWTCQPFAGLCDGQVAGEAGPYPFAFDAVATGAMTAADGSNPRIDIIYVDVDDPSEDASSVPAVTRKYLAGVAAGSPSAPSAPAGCMTVAQINVPKSGGGAPTVTWVAPYLAAAGGTVQFPTKAAMDLTLNLPTGTKGLVLADLKEYVFAGTSWVTTSEPPACALRLATIQTLTTSDVAVAWDAEIADASGMHNSTNKSRITAVQAGLYEVSAQLYNSNTSGYGTVSGRLNGTTAIEASGYRQSAAGNEGTPLITVFPVVLAVGDYVEILVKHSTASGQLVASGLFASTVTVKRVGAA